jgi:hypothetical protein
MLTVEGGRGAHGSAGGLIKIRTLGPATIDPTVQPTVPAAPAGATVIEPDALATDVVSDGSIRISAIATLSGGDPVRRISSANGDIFIDGSVRSAPLDSARQGIVLSAPNGTVFIWGAVDTSGQNGQAGGTIEITARRVVVSGRLSSAGGNGTDAAGAAGAITITASTDVVLSGLVRARGGGTTGAATGGAAAPVKIEAPGAVQLAGTIDARGGPSTGGGDAGAAGAIHVGAATPPASLQVFVPVVASGGEGAAVGGAGGFIQVDAAGAITVVGELHAEGGAATSSSGGDGGVAGDVTLNVTSAPDKIVVAATGKVIVDGGTASGAGHAGGGGHLFFFTLDGEVTIGGKMSACGGAAPDAGGSGGLGGVVNIFSDNNNNGLGGNLTVETTGVIDASGGSGTYGGSARNDGTSDVVFFPDPLERIAIILNSDGIHGTPPRGNAMTLNFGLVRARGAASNGAGGDVIYHGNGAGDLTDPESGTVDNAADGNAMSGQWAGS